MLSGFENYYLLTATGTPLPGANATYAERVLTKSDGGGSQAWIAGPVVGGVVALGLVAAAVCWWQRKQQRRRTGTKVLPNDEIDVPSQRVHMLPKHPIEMDRDAEMLPEKDGNATYELSDPNTERLYQHEK